nr:TonB-dependent receptor [Saprospiraceae bacterium]
ALQDVSFKLDFGKGKTGRFSLFGIGGRSDINFLGSEIDEGDLFAAEDEDSFVEGSFGVVGLKHNIILNKKTYVRTVLASSFRQNTFSQDRYFDMGTDHERKIDYTEVDTRENQLSLSSYINYKFDARQTIRAGLLIQNAGNDALFRDRDEQPDFDGDGDPDWFTLLQFDGRYTMLQPFVQTQYRIGKNITLNAGLHGQYSGLNEQFVLEPRASLSYEVSPRDRLTLGYGMHNQHAPLPIMLLNEQVDGALMQTNIGLDFVRSQHFVLGYDGKLGENWRLKTELYYQDIDRAPVESVPSSYSTLTEGADFVFATDKTSLVSEGQGFNRGLEVTLEKFYSRGYHLLLTTSIFDSRYQGSDGVERSTPFDNGYVVNILGGREFKVGRAKRNAFVIDTKFTTAGGRWFTPVDLERSRIAGAEVLNVEEAFSQQYDSYLRWDIKVGFKFNSRKKKVSHQLFFDAQNVTNRQNIFVRQFNRLTNNVDRIDQVGFFPDFLYRIQF